MSARERFEKWARGAMEFYPLTRYSLPDGPYHNDAVQRAWSAWLAAKADDAEICLDQRCKWCRDAGETNVNHADCCACRDDAAAIRASDATGGR